jgi:hypothetical protein
MKVKSNAKALWPYVASKAFHHRRVVDRVQRLLLLSERVRVDKAVHLL